MVLALFRFRRDRPEAGDDEGSPRRRARPGTLERPVSTRLYRAGWIAVAVPLLIAAFSVTPTKPQEVPRVETSFDQTTAAAFASELIRRFPDREPGSAGGQQATNWLAERFRDVGLQPDRDEFEANVAGLGDVSLVNLVAIAPGRSPETIVVMAHRDNSGRSPGANDNASGTAALLELARGVEVTQPAHTLVFLSTDAGAFGGAGAARFAERPELVRRLVGGGASIVAVVNLDSLAGTKPRLVFAGEAARSPSSTLLATAEERIVSTTGQAPARPNGLEQLVDLGFPFTLHEQGPFVAVGTPAVTLTSGGERPPVPEGDTLESFEPDRLGALGRSAQELLLALDASAELARGTDSYLYFGTRILRGWAIQFLLLAALIPFLVATVDLFARCRRRHVALAPALRSLLSRLGVWLWIGALFAIFSLAGVFADGDARPISPDSEAAGNWPVIALVAFGVLSGLGWLVVRPRLVPRREIEAEESLGGHLAAMLVLGLVALIVAATNPYALIFVLPSLHAWLWLAQIPRANIPLRLAVFAAGFAGPLLILGSLAFRYDLGLDALWYLLALFSVGYVAFPLLLAALVWATVAGQVGALAVGRYAPYPRARDRAPRGPIRETIRRLVLYSRRRRSGEPHLELVEDERALEER